MNDSKPDRYHALSRHRSGKSWPESTISSISSIGGELPLSAIRAWLALRVVRDQRRFEVFQNALGPGNRRFDIERSVTIAGVQDSEKRRHCFAAFVNVNRDWSIDGIGALDNFAGNGTGHVAGAFRKSISRLCPPRWTSEASAGRSS